jgi:hypothetical protein
MDHHLPVFLACLPARLPACLPAYLPALQMEAAHSRGAVPPSLLPEQRHQARRRGGVAPQPRCTGWPAAQAVQEAGGAEAAWGSLPWQAGEGQMRCSGARASAAWATPAPPGWRWPTLQFSGRGMQSFCKGNPGLKHEVEWSWGAAGTSANFPTGWRGRCRRVPSPPQPSSHPHQTHRPSSAFFTLKGPVHIC